MTPTPADRRRVLRHTIECAIGLDSTTRNGQTGALTATVWRVIEPALTQRDAQLDAVRAVMADMEGVTGARFWAGRLRKALDVKRQPPVGLMRALGPDEDAWIMRRLRDSYLRARQHNVIRELSPTAAIEALESWRCGEDGLPQWLAGLIAKAEAEGADVPEAFRSPRPAEAGATEESQ